MGASDVADGLKMKFDHIGVVVSDLQMGVSHFAATFGIRQWSEAFSDPENKVNVQFGLDRSGVCYELISPLGENSPIQRALKERGPILNHIAYLVESLEEGAAHLREQGYMAATRPTPAIAYGMRPIQFFVSRLGFIVELIENFDHGHNYSQM